MIGRGQPFPPTGDRPFAVVYCPYADCQRALTLQEVRTLGPHQDEDDQLRPPFFRYVCKSHGAPFVFETPRLA